MQYLRGKGRVASLRPTPEIPAPRRRRQDCSTATWPLSRSWPRRLPAPLAACTTAVALARLLAPTWRWPRRKPSI